MFQHVRDGARCLLERVGLLREGAGPGSGGPEHFVAGCQAGDVLAAAIELADRDGIESMSMRKLAHELGVEAMSLYTHVRNKNELLDGMADAVISQIPVSAGGAGWKASTRSTSSSTASPGSRAADRPRLPCWCGCAGLRRVCGGWRGFQGASLGGVRYTALSRVRGREAAGVR
jgi:hypothetical protein